jgi:tetratricopeptide (TPR) repeat protein
MAKRKKLHTARPARQRPSAKLARQIEAALTLYYRDNDTVAARQALLELAGAHPRSRDVLEAVLELAAELHDWQTLAIYGQQLLPLQPKAEQSDTLNNLLYAHIQLSNPAIARDYALQLISQINDGEKQKEIQALIESTEAFMLTQAEAILPQRQLTQEEKLQLLLQHDWIHFYTESGNSEKAIPLAEALVEEGLAPIPVLNNLSMSYWMLGQAAAAIATAQQVLDSEPENIHGLGNMIRFTFLTGQFDQAEQYAQRLKQLTDDRPERYLKQIEALAFLGDDEAIIAAYKQLQTQAETRLTPLALHLAAAAYYRQKKAKTAWRLWRQAVRLAPDFEMAQVCLDDRDKPVGERHIPWYWPYNYWLPPDFSQFLGQQVGAKSDKALRQRIMNYLAERPYLSQLWPHMLDRGDKLARELVIHLARLTKLPELMPALYQFARGPVGPDELRLQAAQIVRENAAQLLPADKRVTMWLNGQQQELVLLAFKIDYEPSPAPGRSDEILDKAGQAHELIQAGNLDAAEKLVEEIIAAEPDFPTAHNYRAVIAQQRGDVDRVRQITEEIYVRFPDYFFGRVTWAQLLIQDKRLEEAEALLNPLLEQEELHVSEFHALANAHMELALAKDKPEAARSWLDMWQQIDEDDPQLWRWRLRLFKPAELMRSMGKLFDSD